MNHAPATAGPDPAPAPGGVPDGTPDLLLTPDPDRAARALLAGGLVGLPTETVYGLAADAEDRAAVARIYTVKGRPADHPVIVHVRGAAALEPVRGWVGSLPDYARRLAEALWPGPLTLVLPRGPRAGDWVTGGLPGVGLRAPDHPAAAAVLDAVAALGERRHPGLAAPSANRFGRVSPTRAADVLADLGPLLDPDRDRVLDGGASRVGVESTIVDCTGPAPVVLRPGAVGADRVRRVGGVPVAPPAAARVRRAPGTLAAHYAPRAVVRLAEDPDHLTALLGAAGPKGAVGLLAPAAVATPVGVLRLSAPADAAGYARALYPALREADAYGLAEVLVVPPVDHDGTDGTDGSRDSGGSAGALATAVRDRLRRAATGSARG